MFRSLAVALALLGSLVVPASRPAAIAQRVPRHGQRAAARDAGQPATCCRQAAGSRHHLCRPFHLLYRHARRRADRNRFQRRLPDRAAARRRHHEPGALDPLHAVSRPEDSARPARLGRKRTAGAGLDARRRRLYPQRDHRHPPLLWRGFWRPDDQGRQLDLHLRGRRSLHRSSRPFASQARRDAFRGDRPARYRDGADRRHLYDVARRRLRDHQAAARLRGTADAPLRYPARRIHAPDRPAIRHRPTDASAP